MPDAPNSTANSGPLYLGIDLGTSGIRLHLINEQQQDVLQVSIPLGSAEQLDGNGVQRQPADWRHALEQAWAQMAKQVDCQQIKAIAVDGTSGTVFLASDSGEPLSPALMYNDARSITEAEQIARHAPASSPTRAVTSGLSKLLWLEKHYPRQNAHLIHQADDLIWLFTGQLGHSDSNNCLKSGYDAVQKQWPAWIDQLDINATLPVVHEPGTIIANVSAQSVEEFGLNPDCVVVAGTTDSHAAAVATGINNVGDAVTSLGSTLVTKIISRTPIFNAEYGVYSQPFGENWLVGGASNSGGAVLRHYFADEQLQALTEQLDPDTHTGLDYYPLLKPGERFPINDAVLQPRLTPRPDNDAIFFQGLLEGIAQIEKLAYDRLHALGAPYPASVTTAGGGSVNTAWTSIREKTLGVKIISSINTQAAYGSALLAKFACT